MSSVSSLNISLPQALKDFVEGQVASAWPRSPSESIGAQIRDDQKRRTEEKPEALLLYGLNCGEPVENVFSISPGKEGTSL